MPKRFRISCVGRASDARLQPVVIELTLILKIPIVPSSFRADKTPGNTLLVQPSCSANTS